MAEGLKWHGDEAKAHVAKLLRQRMERAAVTLKNAIKQEISEPSPPASAAGEPPHKDTGRLRASISHEVTDNGGKPRARVGTNVKYGKWLELGTKQMASRPFIMPTYTKLRSKLLAMIKGSGK